MRRILILISLIFVWGTVFGKGFIRTYMSLDTAVLPESEVSVLAPSESAEEKHLDFIQETRTPGCDCIGFTDEKITLVPDFKLIHDTLSDLTLETEEVLLIGAQIEESKLKCFHDGLAASGISSKVVIESDPSNFIRNFKNHAAAHTLIMIFQDSPLLTKSNQKLIATLIISLKKILISLGISSKAPGILSFTPSDEDLKTMVGNYFIEGNPEKYTMSQVNFNLRYAAIIGLKFKTAFLSKVKRVI